MRRKLASRLVEEILLFSIIIMRECSIYRILFLAMKYTALFGGIFPNFANSFN